MSFFTAFDFNKFFTSFLILFAVVDVLGSTATIVSMRRKIGYIHARKTAKVVGFIMVTFLFLGQAILNVFSIDIASFSIAGSIILFLIGMEMCLNITIIKLDTDTGTSSVIPLAFPIIADAGTLATLITLKVEYETINVLCATIVNVFLIFLVLKYSERIEEKLGKLSITIIQRMMGIILLSIALKIFKMNFYL
jgi:multiple antibiotic resistance protein